MNENFIFRNLNFNHILNNSTRYVIENKKLLYHQYAVKNWKNKKAYEQNTHRVHRIKSLGADKNQKRGKTGLSLLRLLAGKHEITKPVEFIR